MSGVYLFETKTKGDIRPEQMQQQLTFDLQTMLYLVAMSVYGGWPSPVKGLIYNVIRRPLAGGRHSIKQGQKETRAEYLERLRVRIEGEPDFFFMRWKVEVSQRDIQRFRMQCLDPILEQLYDWWEYIDHQRTAGNDYFAGYYRIGGHWECPHWRHPYGVFSVLNEGGSAEYDDHLDSGTMLGLERTGDLFPELSQ